jgi:spore coat protein A
MLTRRTFIARSSLGGFGVYLWSQGAVRLLAQVPAATLDSADIPQFVTPLLVPPAMPLAGRVKARGGRTIDYYEIAVRQFSQQILPLGRPRTTVWGYGPNAADADPQIFNAPSLTIEARSGRPVRIKWVNQLVDTAGQYLPHLLPVDPTLHWANPPGGVKGRDSRPRFDDGVTPGRYTGPVPLVTHVHGAVAVGDESDGYPEAWYLPAASNIPAGHATEGSWYGFFRRKAAPRVGPWEPGSATFQYPNTQRASTAWYHDHTLGMTRLNVYAGPAGFFIVRGGPGDDVVDTRSGLPAALPGPAPALGDPAGTTYFEIPLAIQDRSFNVDGSLFYPATREFFDEIAGPYIPDTDISPIWNPEFFGNTIIVNGNTWPFLNVEQRRYRFRLLNGCNSRFLILDFNQIPDVEVWQIGNEGGFLAAPVDMTSSNGNRILLSPAERADVIVDFTRVPGGDYRLHNVGPDEPFGGGIPGADFDEADPASTGRVMQFNVGPVVGVDTSTPPQFLQLPIVEPLAGGATRPLALIEKMSGFFDDAPAEAVLGTVAAGGEWTPCTWAEAITENPQVGDTEVWEFYNATADAHPIHIHETVFQVVNRQAIVVEEHEDALENEHGGRVYLAPHSDPRPPEAWESGWKDTVIAYPGEVTRIRASFDTPGQYVWHCHIVEHEDNEMMRPYRIGPMQPGQPVDRGRPDAPSDTHETPG